MNSRLLPEWSPVRAVMIAWPYPEGEWEGTYEEINACYQEILKAFSNQVETWVLVHPSVEKIFNLLCQSFDNTNIHPITVAYNDTWVRDYGPLSLTSGFISFQFNGWGAKYSSELDNEVNVKLASRFSSLQISSLVAEGGALEINDDGILLANKDCLLDKKRNPQLTDEAFLLQLKNELGINEFALIENVALSGDDTDGHIDTLARFVNNRHIVYCGTNPNHPDNDKLTSLQSQLRVLADRHAWQLTELPSPIVVDKVNDRVMAASYANFLLCNKAVFVPVYDVDEDDIALVIFKKVFPEYAIIPIACRALLAQNGSLHCASMQLASAAWQ